MKIKNIIFFTMMVVMLSMLPSFVVAETVTMPVVYYDLNVGDNSTNSTNTTDLVITPSSSVGGSSGGGSSGSSRTGTPQCSDGIDNDQDGRIDYPDDPNCLSKYYSSEGPLFINRTNDLNVTNATTVTNTSDVPEVIPAEDINNFPPRDNIDNMYYGDIEPEVLFDDEELALGNILYILFMVFVGIIILLVIIYTIYKIFNKLNKDDKEKMKDKMDEMKQLDGEINHLKQQVNYNSSMDEFNQGNR